MENRFGFREFVITTLLLLLIVVVFLQMKQRDRDRLLLQSLQSQSDTQTQVLMSIDSAIRQGIMVRGSAGQAAESFPHGDPFGILKEAEAQNGFARGDWFIDNTAAKMKNLTYPVAGDLYSQWVQTRVTEGLIYRDPMTLDYRPQLARDWQVSEDGMTYIFQLRSGVRFSDGQPMTADDVIFSFEFLMNPKVNCPRIRAYLENIKKVEKKGDSEIVFTMAKPYYDSLDLCGTLNIIPKHFLTKFSEEEVNTNPGLLMGTGPWKMPDPTAWRPGQKIELVRNELYWGEQPTFDRLVYLEVEDETAEQTMFGNRELDNFAPQPAQYLAMLKDPKITAHANHYEYDYLLSGYNYIAWNEKSSKTPLFGDARVRRAMSMLTDCQRICDEVYLGYAKPTSGPFAMTSPQADPSLKPIPLDVAGAKALLAEAGFADRDGTGILKDASGNPFRFRLTYGSGNATFERVVLFLKDSYAKAGVTMEPDPVDWPILQKKLDQRDFDAISLGWGGAIESDLYQEFDSSQMADQGDNFMSYSNPKFDALVRKARETIDKPKRMELWHQAHKILYEDQPYTFLFTRLALRFIDNRVQNVKPSKIGLNFVYLYSQPAPWYVPKKLQVYKTK